MERHCPHCDEQFSSTQNIPYLLYCSHTICQKDLELFFKQTNDIGMIICPICAETIDFQFYDGHYPPINQFIMDTLPSADVSSTDSAVLVPSPVPTAPEKLSSTVLSLCQNCNLTNSFNYCTSCQVDLCMQCDAIIHSNKIFYSHHRMTMKEKRENGTNLPTQFRIGNLPITPKNEYCSQHSKEVIKFYCLEEGCVEDPLLCAYCAIQSIHRHHNVVPLENAYEVKKQQFITRQVVDTNNLLNRVKQFQQTVQLTHKDNQAVTESSLESIQKDFNLIYLLLKRFELKLLNHIGKEAKENEETITKAKIMTAQYIEELISAENSIQNYLRSSDPLTFLKQRLKKIASIEAMNQRVQAFLNETIAPTMQSKYEVEEVFPTKALQQLLGHSDKRELPAISSKVLGNDSIDVKSSDFDTAEQQEDAESNTSLIVGKVANYILSTVDQIERTIPLYPRLVVEGLVELEAKEMHLFSSIIIKPGGILTAAGWDGVVGTSGLLYLVVQGSVLIEPRGEINLVGKGYRGGLGSDSFEVSGENGEPYDEGFGGIGGNGSLYYGTIGGGGGGYMTMGKPAKPNTYNGQSNFGGYGGKAVTTDPSESLEAYMRMGSGGGAGSGYGELIGGKGGNGGGLLIIQATEIRNFGRITVNGENGQDGNCLNNYMSGGGGGSGGCVKIECSSFCNYGQITARGGKGGVATLVESPLNNCSNGGDGGDGLIILKYDTITESPSAEIQPSATILSI